MGDGLAGKVALMTGAPTPLSLTVARRLGNEGARIAFIGRKVSRDAGIQALLYQFRRESLCLDADLSDPAAVEAILSCVEEAFGSVDLVVHTLGEPEPQPESRGGGLVIRNSTAPLTAALTTTRGAMNHMQRRQSGHIVHLVSGDQIGAVEVERRALSGLRQQWGLPGGSTAVALSAIYFDEAASLPGVSPDQGEPRVLEIYTGRAIEEDEWMRRVLLEHEIGNLVMRVCNHPSEMFPGRVESFDLPVGVHAVLEVPADGE